MKQEKLTEKRLREDILIAYNNFMRELYVNYRTLSNDEVRLIALETITKHICDKSKSALKRKIRNRTKIIHEVLNPQESKEAVELDF